MNELDRQYQKHLNALAKVDSPDPPHLVLYWNEGETLHAQVGKATAGFPMLTDTHVKQLADAFAWGHMHKAVTWEILNA